MTQAVYLEEHMNLSMRINKKEGEYRRSWLSHLQRMPQNRIPFKSYHYRPQGRRTIGRPKNRWRDQL